MRQRPYIRPLHRVKEEYSAMLRSKKRIAKLGPRPATRIPDNSEPWIENPNTVAEFWEIACRVSELEERYRLWSPTLNTSSITSAKSSE